MQQEYYNISFINRIYNRTEFTKKIKNLKWFHFVLFQGDFVIPFLLFDLKDIELNEDFIKGFISYYYDVENPIYMLREDFIHLAQD